MATLVLAIMGMSAVAMCCMRRGAPGRLFAAAPRARSPHALASAASERGRYTTSIEEAASALSRGELVAFPTETVYGLSLIHI